MKHLPCCLEGRPGQLHPYGRNHSFATEMRTKLSAHVLGLQACTEIRAWNLSGARSLPCSLLSQFLQVGPVGA